MYTPAEPAAISTTSDTPVAIWAAASITAGTPSADPETKHGPRPSSYTRSLLSEPVTALTSPGWSPAFAERVQCGFDGDAEGRLAFEHPRLARVAHTGDDDITEGVVGHERAP